MNRNITRVVSAGSMVAALLASDARGDYVATVQSSGLSAITVSPGDLFTLDVVFTSNTNDSQNSAIFRLVFSDPGLEELSYTWKTPYQTGSIFDACTPSAQSLPAIITADTLNGPGEPPGVVALELGNVATLGPSFSSGTIVQLGFQVPLGWSGSGAVFIVVDPDTIANGFEGINTTAGPSFTLNIVPSPASISLILGSFILVASRRGRP